MTAMDDTQAVLVERAAQVMKAGSRSFAAAARLFDAPTRESAVLLYAWCRHCDDVIDGQVLGHGQREGDRGDALQRLDRLQELTLAACEGRPVDDPVFAGLADVVQRHGIPASLALEHLRGFAMDVHGVRYETLADTLQYCWRVAGVVGVMMSRVMGASDPGVLDRACDLGIAFQLTNIARDVVEDAAIGRVYLPAQWLREEGLDHLPEVLDPGRRDALARVASRLVAEAEPYYRSALAGIAELPLRRAWSIATARGVYREIGRKVCRNGGQAWDERIGTGTLEKLWFVARGAAVALAAPRVPLPDRDTGLFTRPM